MSENIPSPSNSEDEINLKGLILPLWKARKQILITSLIFAVLGGIIAFMTPATYTASSTFLPQTSQASGGLSGSLGGLASIAGINLNASMAGGDIPPSMYSKLLASEPFRKRILDGTIWIDGDSVNYRNYLENRPRSVLEILNEYTIGLPGKLLGLFIVNEKESQKLRGSIGLQPLSNNEYGLINAVLGRVNIITDKREGFITISVIESDPIIAAQVAIITEEILQEWISEQKMKNAKFHYEFIKKQFESKQKEYFLIQDKMSGYMDQNQNINSQFYRIRMDRLQSEFDLAKNIYSELAMQMEQAAIQLSKDTPTFTLLDPVKVPKEKTSPKKKIYIISGFFMGIFLSGGWFLVRDSLLNFINSIQNAS
jgi:capsular polysaccharide biosynthesis protein